LDGGGVKGLMSLEILKKIEEETGKKIHETFDLICGTSTGGIISLSSVFNKMTVDQMIDMYINLGSSVFNVSPTKQTSQFISHNEAFDTNKLQDFAKNLLGENVEMTSVSHPKTFVISSDATNSETQIAIFCNYPSERSYYNASSKLKAWEAIRATSAVPLYLKPLKIGEQVYLDGGLVANNPCCFAYHEISKLFPGIRIDIIVSIGTGTVKPVPYREGIYDFASRVKNEATDVEHAHQEMLRKAADHQFPYFRLNPPGGDIGIFDVSEQTRQKMIQIVKEYLETQTQVISEIVEKLK